VHFCVCHLGITIGSKNFKKKWPKTTRNWRLKIEKLANDGGDGRWVSLRHVSLSTSSRVTHSWSPLINLWWVDSNWNLISCGLLTMCLTPLNGIGRHWTLLKWLLYYTNMTKIRFLFILLKCLSKKKISSNNKTDHIDITVEWR
jgi:hypothetical protein